MCAVAVFVEGVGVLHGELAPTHQAKARTALVAELGLNLVQVLGQLLVAFELLARDVGDDFFAGGLNHEIAPMAVLDAQQLGAHLVKAAGFLPQLSGLHHRHGHFNGTSAVHFFAHDGFDLAHHAQPHGHIAIDPGAQLFDHAGARHQLVADDLGVRGGFFQGRDKKLGGFHGEMAMKTMPMNGARRWEMGMARLPRARGHA